MYANLLVQLYSFQSELNSLPGVQVSSLHNKKDDLYSKLITDSGLRRATEKLFRDGHHARAVEEAYKYLDNVVKMKAKPIDKKLSGSSLMQKVFSTESPILKINAEETQSEIDEQKGYLQIFSGSMTGIRNPRAHECDWEDSEERALELLAMANHLVGKVRHAELV